MNGVIALLIVLLLIAIAALMFSARNKGEAQQQNTRKGNDEGVLIV